MKKANFSLSKFLMCILQGALIGLGAVLPGISGGVLCVVFGIYKPVMELLANPFRNFKTHVPKLIPVIIGMGVGFLGVAKVLSFFLDKFPSQSVCLFVGLIGGMMPSLFREAGEQGRSKFSYISMAIAAVLIFALLTGLKVLNVTIDPNFAWYIFCGVCLALSVIAPGMSFSTLLMPLGLYEPFVAGIGNFDFSILIPAGVGALATVILFAKAIDSLFNHHYSVSFHAIVGIVIAATIMIIPFGSILSGVLPFIIHMICLVVGVIAALLLDEFNKSVMAKEHA